MLKQGLGDNDTSRMPDILSGSLDSECPKLCINISVPSLTGWLAACWQPESLCTEHKDLSAEALPLSTDPRESHIHGAQKSE